ncbi:MAG: uracil-DNA glycosylase family protein [Dehalococcoidia bacterium]
MSELSDLAQMILRCPDCRLCETRTQAVPGEGPEDAEIMFIGEGPGFNEDRTGRPFVGAAGKFLDQLLGAAGLKREEVFIANVVKCRPPNNRDPMPDEIAACGTWLDRQIELIKPAVIVTLGRHSMNRFIPGATISRIHGVPRDLDGIMVVPMFHPAAALHQERYRSLILADFQKLPEILAAAKQRAPAHTPAAPEEPKPVAVEQGRLF